MTSRQPSAERRRAAPAAPAVRASRPAARVARFELSCGSVEALSAERFTDRYPPHFHETFAIGVVESGATRLRTARGEHEATAGSLLVLSPGEVHAAVPACDEGYTYRMVYPSLGLMREIGVDVALVEQGAPLFEAPVVASADLARALLDAHRAAMDGDGSAAGRHAESRLVGALRRIVDRHGAMRDAAARWRVRDHAAVERARRYLHAHYAEPVRLASVAAECGMSLCHLIRTFHRVAGVPPYAYLVQVRVNEARAMLRDGVGLADAAYACGFSDQSHLTRTFKKALGVPPGQYIREAGYRVA